MHGRWRPAVERGPALSAQRFTESDPLVARYTSSTAARPSQLGHELMHVAQKGGRQQSVEISRPHLIADQRQTTSKSHSGGSPVSHRHR